MGMAAEYAWWRKVGGRCARKRAGSSGNDMSTIAKAEAALNKCGQRTRFIWLCTVVLLAMVMSSAAPSAFTDDLVARELVHCAASSCDEAAAAATPPHGRLVWRAPKGRGPQRDLEKALYQLPAVLSHPLELHWWPYKAVTPFRGPFLALVSTRPKNVARRAAIRAGWGNPAQYPNGSFRLIFFLAAPAKPGKENLKLKRLLKCPGSATHCCASSCVESTMVHCAVYGCSNRTRNKLNDENFQRVGFYVVPKVKLGQCAERTELSSRRRALQLSRIRREDLDESASRYRVCGTHCSNV
ncbi:hypothetical protein HPB52_012320 [Rhipicephalus sanguineus]|uniref:Uncharacterized protein n=1 Tax=Rhipicephalus sanguineus TaxID=34632 RepID=A0A9D4STY7_RHISA|nr:hypothetical protein HPB52_012320 [Rhipicephalus sanguineus]